MQVHKVTLLVVDHDEVGTDDIKAILENNNYPNDCIAPHVMDVKTVEVDWPDTHPLNLRGEQEAEFKRLFDDKEKLQLLKKFVNWMQCDDNMASLGVDDLADRHIKLFLKYPKSVPWDDLEKGE